MKTPITDAAKRTYRAHDPRDNWSYVDTDVARRLETDRATLLEFAIRVRNTTSSTRIKREAATVIAEARANFPD